MATNQGIRKAFKFFLEHAGYCTPPGRAACALMLAKAERDGAERGLSVTWEDDEQVDFGPADRRIDGYACECGLPLPVRWGSHVHYDEGDSRCVSQPHYGLPSCDATEHTSEWARLVDEDGNTLASLGAITDATREYRRVIEAELMSEALHDVRTAEANDRESSRYMAL